MIYPCRVDEKPDLGKRIEKVGNQLILWVTLPILLLVALVVCFAG